MSHIFFFKQRYMFLIFMMNYIKNNFFGNSIETDIEQAVGRILRAKHAKPIVVDIIDSHVFDFGRISENSNSFIIATKRYPNNFKGILYPNETIRYCLKIDAVGFRQKKHQIFEVTWNGQWSDDEEKMKNNVKIIEVKD